MNDSDSDFSLLFGAHRLRNQRRPGHSDGEGSACDCSLDLSMSGAAVVGPEMLELEVEGVSPPAGVIVEEERRGIEQRVPQQGDHEKCDHEKCEGQEAQEKEQEAKGRSRSNDHDPKAT